MLGCHLRTKDYKGIIYFFIINIINIQRIFWLRMPHPKTKASTQRSEKLDLCSKTAKLGLNSAKSVCA